MESNLGIVEAKGSGLLPLFNGLEVFGLSTAVQKRRTEDKHQHIEISCPPDSFEVVETNSFKASFSNSVS